MADFWYDPRERWCVRMRIENLPRTFTGFPTEDAAKQAARLQSEQYARTGTFYDQRELRQLGLCGTPSSYDEALVKRRNTFGIVNPDGSIRRLIGGRRDA